MDIKDNISAVGKKVKEKVHSVNISLPVVKRTEQSVSIPNADVLKEKSLKRKLGKEKKIKLEDELERSIREYNVFYEEMKDWGMQLFLLRQRAADLIDLVERFINSIANHPKSFDSDIAEIRIQRQEFVGVCEYAKDELEAAKKSAISVGSGVAAGGAVASLAPSAAMWIATTFGTASTGTAISTLSGAAATNAALAWLGGGAVAAGGSGMAAGNALLALAGPVGWGIAGATLLTSMVLFARKKLKNKKTMKEEIEGIKRNTEAVRELARQIKALYQQTSALRENLNNLYDECLVGYGKRFDEIEKDNQVKLGTLVNNTKALSMTLSKNI